MKLNIGLTLIACFALGLSVSAQTSSDQKPAPEHKLGEYVVNQAVEFGYRFTDVSGARFPCATGTCEDFSMYDTLANYHTGPRLLEQDLQMRASAGSGLLFDSLLLNSFGFGGDPYDGARLRMDKTKIYRLNVNFRRDQNFFNYDLLANPLNPPTPPNTPLLYSPHRYFNVRRMSDVDLTIAPQSRVSLRLGYDRNRVEGPAFSTFHMPRGTDINPVFLTNTTSDTYRAGIDFRVTPSTTVSYDQFYTHFKGDNSWQNLTFPFLVGGIPADFGVSYNVDFAQPCALAVLFTPRCNQDQSFNRSDRYRTNIRTEQLSFRSRPWRRIDLNGRFNYNTASMAGLFQQAWTGLTAGSRTRQEIITNASQNRRVSGSADFGITVGITDRIRLVNNLRWINWRVPQQGIITDTAWIGPRGTNALTPIASITPVTSFAAAIRALKLESQMNQTELEVDFTKAYGARVGYRYEHRFILHIDESVPLTSPSDQGFVGGDVEAGSDDADQPIHTALFGLWFRPSEKLRGSFDVELSSAGLQIGGTENVLGVSTPIYGFPHLVSNQGLGESTRITPRKEQRYKLRLDASPRRWVIIGLSGNLWHARNDYADVLYDFRNANAGFNTTLLPNGRFSFDLGYNFNNYHQNALICPIDAPFNPSFLTGSSVLSAVCPFDLSDTGPTGLFQAFGRYENVNQFGSLMLRGKVVPRLTASAGYTISTSNGSQIYTDPLQVPGSLKNNFHKPAAELEFEIHEGLSAKAAWNYYGYNEKSAAGPTIPRDFHANNTTISLRYAF